MAQTPFSPPCKDGDSRCSNADITCGCLSCHSHWRWRDRLSTSQVRRLLLPEPRLLRRKRDCTPPSSSHVRGALQRRRCVLRWRKDCTSGLPPHTAGLYLGGRGAALLPHNFRDFLGGGRTGLPPHNVGVYFGGGGTGSPPHNAGEYFGGGGTGPPPRNVGVYLMPMTEEEATARQQVRQARGGAQTR